MRNLVAAALMLVSVSVVSRARAETGVADIGSDAFGLDALDAPLDTSVDTAVVDTAPEADADANDDTAIDAELDTFVEDTTTAPTDTGAMVDAIADTAKPDTTLPPLDSAGPNIPSISDAGWDPRGRSPDDDSSACTCGVVGRNLDTRVGALALLVPLVVIARRRRR